MPTVAERISHSFLNKYFTNSDTKLNAEELLSDINGKFANTKDYAGRILLELLQNADDAAVEAGNFNACVKFILDDRILSIMNQGKPFEENGIHSICLGHLSTKIRETELTGKKGIGFRGVLNWAQKVKIFSGDFAIVFSREDCEKILKEKYANNPVFNAVLEYEKNNYTDPISKELIFSNLMEKWPIFNMPHDTTFPENWNKDCFDTRIDLYLKEDANVREEIRTFEQKELDSLLFLRAIKTIEFEIHDDNKTDYFNVHINKGNPDKEGHSITSISLSDNGTISQKNFHVFNVDEESVALPFDWRHGMQFPLYCIFPAKNTVCPFSVIMHSAKFNVTSNRDALSDRPIDNRENKNIVSKLNKMLVDVVVPYFAKKEYGTMALDILAQNGVNNALFDTEMLKSVYIQACSQNIVPTISGQYKSLNNNLKYLEKRKHTIKTPDYLNINLSEALDIIIGDNTNEYINDDTLAILEKTPEFKTKVHCIDSKDMYGIISKKNQNLSRKQRVCLLYFWLENIDRRFPPLIMDTEGVFFESISGEHMRFYSGQDIKSKPTWFSQRFISKDDQEELYNCLKTESLPQEQQQHKYRFLSSTYTTVFKGDDKSDVFASMLNQAKNNFDYCVDLLKCIYINYSKEKSLPQSWNITTHHIIPTLDKKLDIAQHVFFGDDWGVSDQSNIINNTICKAAGKNSIATPQVFGLKDQAISDFKTFISNFFDIKNKIEATNAYVYKTTYNMKFFDAVSKKIKEQKKIYNESISVDSVYVHNIYGLENILNSANNLDVLHWLNENASIFLSDLTADVTYKVGNQKGQNIDQVHVPSYIACQILNIPWLVIDKKRLKPCDCLLPDKRNIKYPDDIVAMVPHADTFKTLWNMIGIRDKAFYLSAQIFYELLNRLPTIDTDGKISCAIYDDIARCPEDEKNFEYLTKNCAERTEFLINGKVWTKQKKFVRVANGVYFAGKKVHNLKNDPIIDTPIRCGAFSDFNSIFGVKKFTESIEAEFDKCELHPESDATTEKFKEFKPYLHCLNATEKLNKSLNNLDFYLATNLKIVNVDTPVPFDPYDTIPAHKANKYIIYVPSTTKLNSKKITRAIANVCNTISSSADVVDTIELLYDSDNESRIERLKEKGCDIKLLETYTDLHKQFVDIVQDIKPDANIESYAIDFENFQSESNTNKIIKIFDDFGLRIEDFETRGFTYIDFVPYNKSKLNMYITQKKKDFCTGLYNELMNQPEEKQKEFFEMCDIFENNINTANVPNIHCYDPAIYFPIPNPHVSQMVEYTDALYSKERKKLDDLCDDKSILEQILQNKENKSLLLFGNIELIQKKYEDKVASTQQQETKDIIVPHNENNKQIVINTGAKMSNSSHLDNHPRRVNHQIYTHSEKMERKKRENGLCAEQQVYDKLVELHGVKNVNWVSSNAYTARKKTYLEETDDSKGYDMTYTDADGILHYVEVKNGTHIRQNDYAIEISANEERFARNNLQVYAVYVVTTDQIDRVSGNVLLKYLDNGVNTGKQCTITIEPASSTAVFLGLLKNN